MPSIPQPGDLAPGFTAEPGQCWRMIYSAQNMQGTHCPEPVAWRGRFSNEGKSWTVESCEHHVADLTACKRI